MLAKTLLQYAYASETSAEAELVDVLPERAKPVISLVTEENDTIVGHIMFSPVSLSGHPGLKIMGLAPMAVAGAHQRCGVGSALVRAGLDLCKELRCGRSAEASGILPRFGFSPSTRYSIRCEYDAPDEAFMVIELEPAYFRGKSGTIVYHPAFGAL
jgi:putative acetyltransferase